SIPVTTTIFASEAEISAAIAEKVPIQMGIFFCLKFSTPASSVAVVASQAPPLIVPLCHSDPSSILLFRDCSTSLLSIVMLLI
ncbi:hypothetical protein, partial [Aeromonas veronii]